MLSNKLKGLRRDRLILRTIEEWEVLDTKLIRAMFFNDFKDHYVALRKTQHRMKLLSDRGKVERWVNSEGGYVYGEKTGRWEHRLLLNWVRMHVEIQTANWEKIHSFQYEPDYKFIRPDALVSIKNIIESKFNFIFIELDRTTSNPFEPKIKNYNRLFEEINSGKHQDWWVKLSDKFPRILVVTTSPERQKNILSMIGEANTNNLRFDVKLLDKGVVM